MPSTGECNGKGDWRSSRLAGHDPVNTGPTNAQAFGDLHRPQSLCPERLDLISLGPRRRFTSLVSALSFRLGDAFPLTLQHHLAFELGYRAQNVEHELAGGAGGVKVHG